MSANCKGQDINAPRQSDGTWQDCPCFKCRNLHWLASKGKYPVGSSYKFSEEILQDVNRKPSQYAKTGDSASDNKAKQEGESSKMYHHNINLALPASIPVDSSHKFTNAYVQNVNKKPSQYAKTGYSPNDDDAKQEGEGVGTSHNASWLALPAEHRNDGSYKSTEAHYRDVKKS